MQPSSLTDNEVLIRVSVFIGVLLLLIVLESLLPRKQRVMPRQQRWITNLSLVVIDALALRLLVPLLAMGGAAIAAARGWGLFNVLDWPLWLELILSVVLLDMLVYWQHVISHHVPLLWSIHKVHHADRDIDVTTGLRFHPLEIVLSMLYKLFCVGLLGPPVLAVFVFELLLNACAMFNHANLALPRWLDRMLRTILVTPDMHRIHHSVVPAETNSNYGFSISLWDFLFGSYSAQPVRGHDAMLIGLEEEQTARPASLGWCLLWPFQAWTRGLIRAAQGGRKKR